MIEVVESNSKSQIKTFSLLQLQPCSSHCTLPQPGHLPKMENHQLRLCILIATSLVAWSEAAPVRDIHQRQVEQINGPHDVRWRLVSGLETAYFYIGKLTKQMKACDNQPLLSPGPGLKPILKGVCELMSVQRITSKIQNGTDLQSILEQNMVDSCLWLNELVASGEIPASARFLELNDSCEIGDMPRLSQYCLEIRLGTFYRKVYEPASDYYTGTVVDQDVPRWLESQLPADQAQSALQTISWSPGQNFTCPFSL